jgi:hypothetical protein
MESRETIWNQIITNWTGHVSEVLAGGCSGSSDFDALVKAKPNDVRLWREVLAVFADTISGFTAPRQAEPDLEAMRQLFGPEGVARQLSGDIDPLLGCWSGFVAHPDHRAPREYFELFYSQLGYDSQNVSDVFANRAHLIPERMGSWINAAPRSPK